MKSKVKITRLDIIILFLSAYAGLGFSIYSLIRQSSYTTELLPSFIPILLWTAQVVVVHIAVKKLRKNRHENT